ncbi:MAG TPA: aldo/keto reductase [Polyangia bacterium]|nr:aldo/keto reductase [Polyangia bacterium]
MASSRRQFVQGMGGVALATLLARRAVGGVPKGPQKGAPKEGDIKLPAGAVMPMRTLGRTGVNVSLLGLGGFHLGIPRDDKEAVRIVHAAMDHGVTFLDNCWDYNDGKSEERMGLALADGRRARAFLMTKLDGRTAASAAQQLEQSLKRLRTDHIDLVQVHEVIRMSDPDRVFGPGGAIEALVAAKKAGKVRFIGFTGHKDPSIHLHMLATAAKHGFTFDTVQMPVNVMDAHYKSFLHEVIPRAHDHDTGVLGMKSLGSGILLQSGVVTAPECLRWSMSQPVAVQITGCDTMGVLEQALSIALGFQPMPAAEAERLLARTAAPAADGRFERFKTSDTFDGTARNPKWLESAQL